MQAVKTYLTTKSLGTIRTKLDTSPAQISANIVLDKINQFQSEFTSSLALLNYPWNLDLDRITS